jgi:uncharacterized lipoprotein YddW (UPF0748 family)
MKRIANSIVFLIWCLTWSIPVQAAEQVPAQRALFVSVLQNPQTLSSEVEIDKLIDFSKRARIEILFVQVYRANQSWFPSKVADQEPYEKCRASLGQDPLALLIKKAHQEGIEVHAWLNLLSLSVNEDAPFLKKYGAQVLTKNILRKKTLADYKIDNQYFLEPGDPRVREDLVKIVKELVGAYKNLDGIQFDYIRYPDVKPQYGYTQANMERFTKATGIKKIDEKDLRWKDWKRDQVTELLTILVKTSRSLHSNIHVSSTGCMPYSRAYHEAFQDWASWLDGGLVEFVTMMNYSDDPAEFTKLNEGMRSKVKDFKKVKIAVGAYKFLKSPKGFEQEFRDCEKSGNTCAVFHYGSLLDNPDLDAILIAP